MTFAIAKLMGSPCQNELLRAGRLLRGDLEVPDAVAVEILKQCPETPSGAPPPPSVPFFSDLLLSDAAQAARLAKCQACAKNVGGNCILCQTCGGRPVAHKVKRQTETCPMGLWPVIS